MVPFQALAQSRKFWIFAITFVASNVSGIVLVVLGKVPVEALTTVMHAVAATASALMLSIGLEDMGQKSAPKKDDQNAP